MEERGQQEDQNEVSSQQVGRKLGSKWISYIKTANQRHKTNECTAGLSGGVTQSGGLFLWQSFV